MIKLIAIIVSTLLFTGCLHINESHSKPHVSKKYHSEKRKLKKKESHGRVDIAPKPEKPKEKSKPKETTPSETEKPKRFDTYDVFQLNKVLPPTE